MKRSAALAALSRDHHQALEVALRLRRAQEGDVDAAIERFLAFWRAIGARHFEIEEQLLLPALPDLAALGHSVEEADSATAQSAATE